MELSQIYNDIITEHSSSGRNKRHIADPTLVFKGVNPTCGDEIELELRLQDGVIQDASFTGTGCAISQASTSIMIDLIRGQTVETSLQLADLFFRMIKQEVTEESQLELLDEAMALQNISMMPARVKCAVLSWHTLKNAIAK